MQCAWSWSCQGQNTVNVKATSIPGATATGFFGHPYASLRRARMGYCTLGLGGWGREWVTTALRLGVMRETHTHTHTERPTSMAWCLKLPASPNSSRPTARDAGEVLTGSISIPADAVVASTFGAHRRSAPALRGTAACAIDRRTGALTVVVELLRTTQPEMPRSERRSPDVRMWCARNCEKVPSKTGAMLCGAGLAG